MKSEQAVNGTTIIGVNSVFLLVADLNVTDTLQGADVVCFGLTHHNGLGVHTCCGRQGRFDPRQIVLDLRVAFRDGVCVLRCAWLESLVWGGRGREALWPKSFCRHDGEMEEVGGKAV